MVLITVSKKAMVLIRILTCTAAPKMSSLTKILDVTLVMMTRFLL
jgi:hypothetical protein